MPVLTREGWVQAGLKILKSKGHEHLSILRVSDYLGVTRGSFYHHFKSLNEYVDAMIQNWEARIVDQGFAQILLNQDDPQEDFQNLIAYISMLSDTYDLMFRQWAASNAHVREHMERLDRKRLKEIVGILERLSRDRAEAEKLGRLTFFAYMGSLHTFPHLSPQEQADAAQDMLDVILRYLNARELT